MVGGKHARECVYQLVKKTCTNKRRIPFPSSGFGDYAVSPSTTKHASPILAILYSVLIMIGLTGVGAVLGAGTDLLKEKGEKTKRGAVELPNGGGGDGTMGDI